jgi:phytoene dehydrogenase-like protein
VAAPIGSLADRLRLLRLARRVVGGDLARIFDRPETTSMALLRAEGFSDAMIRRFFVPFFGGVCLDPQIRASSRVLSYVLRMFATGDAALPARGMGQIPRQLAAGLPAGCVRTGVRVRAVASDGVTLDDGARLGARAVVVAAAAPDTDRLLGRPPAGRSIGETCLYFACDREGSHAPYLMLNGEGDGPVNNVVFPSTVSPDYAPPGRSLAAAVVLGIPDASDRSLIAQVRRQMIDWFGPSAGSWTHLKTYRIPHALPDQSPPTANPIRSQAIWAPGIFICGEHGSLPGIQWAMHSGRRAAEAVRHYLR